MVVTRRKSLEMDQNKSEKEVQNVVRRKKRQSEENRPFNAVDKDTRQEEEKRPRRAEDVDEGFHLNEVSENRKSKKTKSKPTVPGPSGIEIEVVYGCVDEELEGYLKRIYYSPKYECDGMEYRHVIFPRELYDLIPYDHQERLLTEVEWRSLGIKMSIGWQHYELHSPEPHIFLFRRPIPE